ncbi:glycosyltransferase family 2 protein [Rickettsiella endosymbiont of Rhagonycha lignosa]|uniref:glycosyltransferase family 2 protein n=1 Tax=Rickettsiella endosymbiont of Rhagonycha lignosa TaxID=3077937 RepID=UPI00313C912B
MKLISVVTACFNEENNIYNIYEEVRKNLTQLKHYQYEHIFIDNSSTDNTVKLLKHIAQTDKNIKIIKNSRNFGWLRSPYHGILQAKGDAIISISADLQDPPELILEFIKRWEKGFKIVAGIKERSDEFFILFYIRKLYYKLIKQLNDGEIICNYTGFGLYDKSIINILKTFNDVNPFFRGMISEIGFDVAKVSYRQPKRKSGKSRLKLYRLYDVAILGIVNHSKLPLRLVTFLGLSLSSVSLLIVLIHIFLKIFLWKNTYFNFSSLLIGSFLFFSFQILLMGILGEYILAIHTQVLNRPLVIESERTNFVEN